MGFDAADTRVQRLAEGFYALSDEYDRLLAKSRAFERSLQDAKSQFERFVGDRGTVTKDDVADFEFTALTRDIEDHARRPAGMDVKWHMRPDLPMSHRALQRTRQALEVLQQLGVDRPNPDEAGSKVSSEAVVNSSSTMPAISESPLEQDFTVAGTPSRLDCPFASMTNRRMSAHARSVVSRYKTQRDGAMTPRGSGSRLAMVHAPSIDAEDEGPANTAEGCPTLKSNGGVPTKNPGPVCPIRLLDRTGPEEVAEYFAKHKHELPRSHQVCVKRYQSDEASVRQLDAKYGNLVSMIQGLGQKHAPMLPDKKSEVDRDKERVERWASDVSNVKVRGEPDETDQAASPPEEGDGRRGRFDREMKEVRVGESPSRPWGISVPVEAVERAGEMQQELRRRRRRPGGPDGREEAEDPRTATAAAAAAARKCPFSGAAGPSPHAQAPKEESDERKPTPLSSSSSSSSSPRPAFVKSGLGAAAVSFTGPVFIGYSHEQAVQVLQAMKGDGAT